jgi:hypothetical protein
MHTAVAMAAALCTVPMASQADTQFTYTLDADVTTSAAVYNQWGSLVKTLWRGERKAAGTYTVTWDNMGYNGIGVPDSYVTSPNDGVYDEERAPIEYQLRLLTHNVDYVWEGVIGNTSAEFNGPTVFRSFGPPRSLAVAGDRMIIAVGYNEGQPGSHGFALADPLHDLNPLDPLVPTPWWRASKGTDTFISLEMVASDGQRLYWVNGGNAITNSKIGRRSFVLVSDIATQDYVTLPAGQNLCLNFRGDGTPVPIDPATYSGHVCYEGQYYHSVIDVETDIRAQPTGIAVQKNGPILAVAHGYQGLVKLFDKTSGAALGSFTIPVANFSTLQNNQIAMSPEGDLWVIGGTTVRRYTNLSTTPTMAAVAGGFSRPLAVAVHPTDNDLVYVVDGGNRQSLRSIQRNGTKRTWSFGGSSQLPANDPTMSQNRMLFALHSTNASPNVPAADTWAITESAGLAVLPDGSIWVTDTGNGRMLHVDADANYIEEIAYRPASYVSTVDANDPKRVFSNFLEYEVDTSAPLQPGASPSWRLVRNWLRGFPNAQVAARDFQWGGFTTVSTLSNGRTYALADDRLFELPAYGPARDTGLTLANLCPDAVTRCVMYENGDLGYAIGPYNRQNQLVNPSRPLDRQDQVVYRKRLFGFNENGNPWWGYQQIDAGISTAQVNPYVRGRPGFVVGSRFPRTKSNYVVFFDPAVGGDTSAGFPTSLINEGFHLGATQPGWLGMHVPSWVASPSGPLDGKGTFQTWDDDRKINYGGSNVWAVDDHVVYGYHGEFYKDLPTGRVGQANQVMHFHEEGLFIGQFGKTLLVNDPDSAFASPERAGNALSNILVRADADSMYWYHNDESHHAGVHRWRIGNLGSVKILAGQGQLNSSITLQPRP